MGSAWPRPSLPTSHPYASARPASLEVGPPAAQLTGLSPGRLRTGLGRLRTELLRPQPAAPLLRGSCSSRFGRAPRRWKWLWTRSEPQRARIPPLPTLASWRPCTAGHRDPEFETCELVTITDLAGKEQLHLGGWVRGFWKRLWVSGLKFLNIFLSLTHQHNKKKSLVQQQG